MTRRAAARIAARIPGRWRDAAGVESGRGLDQGRLSESRRTGMEGATMRRLLALLSLLAIAIAYPASASGGKAFRETDHAVSVYCDGVSDTSGGWFAYLSFGRSDLYGPIAWLDAWGPSDDDGIPDVTLDPAASAAVAWDGTTLSGSMPVVDQDGTSLGDATFSAELSPIAEPSAFEDAFRDGNAWYRFSGVSQPFQATGTFRLPDGTTFDLALCSADETTVSTFATNPTARVRSYVQRFVGCDLSDTAGNVASLFVDIADEFVYADVWYESADGDIRGAFGVADPPVGGAIDIALEVFDPETGDPTGETANLAMSMTSTGEAYTNLLQGATFRVTERGEVIDIEGSLQIDGATFDLGACIGVDRRIKEIDTRPQGPKPGGKVPSNDAPSGAKVLRVGSSTTTSTRGASPDAEVIFDCLAFTDPDTGDVFAVPVGHTVWYRFTGTGAPMTIDTAGSDFDTVVAIYQPSGGTFVSVPDGCVDDSPVEPIGRTLQANVTIDTIAGATYYVQIGGYPESQPYGNLKVALR